MTQPPLTICLLLVAALPAVNPGAAHVSAADLALVKPKWRIISSKPAPNNAKDPIFLGMLEVEQILPKPRRADDPASLILHLQPERAYVRVSRQTVITIAGRPAAFNELRPGMTLDFTAYVQALMYPAINHATEIQAWPGTAESITPDEIRRLIEHAKPKNRQ